MNSLEKKLQEYVYNGFLLHGSTIDIKDNYLKPNIIGKIYATNSYEIAIMKSIMSNQNVCLNYCWNFSPENPLIILVKNMKQNPMHENGFVYIIKKEDFVQIENNPEFIAYNKNIDILEKIPVKLNDFKTPVYVFMPKNTVMRLN